MPAFQGQVALVIGGTGGIGRAIAGALYAGGARLCVVGRSQHSLDSLVREEAWADRSMRFAVDLERDDEISGFCNEICSKLQAIDVLVHSAGAIDQEPFASAPLEAFDRQYRVNVRAPFQITKAFLPAIVAAQGQVVFINSTAGVRGKAGAVQYAATKHAVRALADGLRDEVNASGVRVLSMILGRTATAMQEWVYKREGRPYDPVMLLQADDVAAMVVNALALPRTAEVTDITMRPMRKTY